MTSKELRERLNTMAAADVSRDIPRLIADAITALESAEARIAELEAALSGTARGGAEDVRDALAAFND